MSLGDTAGGPGCCCVVLLLAVCLAGAAAAVGTAGAGTTSGPAGRCRLGGRGRLPGGPLLHDGVQIVLDILPHVKGIVIAGDLHRALGAVGGIPVGQVVAANRGGVGSLHVGNRDIEFSGLLVLDDNGVALDLVEVIHLPQQVVDGLEEVVIGTDIHVHQHVGVHVTGPAHTHPLEPGQPLQDIPQGLWPTGGADVGPHFEGVLLAVFSQGGTGTLTRSDVGGFLVADRELNRFPGLPGLYLFLKGGRCGFLLRGLGLLFVSASCDGEEQQGGEAGCQYGSVESHVIFPLSSGSTPIYMDWLRAIRPWMYLLRSGGIRYPERRMALYFSVAFACWPSLSSNLAAETMESRFSP